MTIAQGLLFRRRSGGVVKIDSTPLERLLHFRQLEEDAAEAGGVLLGRVILGSDDVIVDEVTVPMPGDVRTRQTFERNADHQQLIDDRWQASKGTCLYLGEWHTHPELSPLPSLVDLGDWCRRLRTDLFDGDSLFFVIVGTREVRAWEGLWHSLTIVPLPVERCRTPRRPYIRS